MNKPVSVFKGLIVSKEKTLKYIGDTFSAGNYVRTECKTHSWHRDKTDCT